MNNSLVDRARSGETDAFETLLRDCDDRMRSVAYRMLGTRDAMDDALQDAYVRAYRAMGSFRGDARFSTWLHRIVTTTCIDHMRRRDRRREVALPDDGPDHRPPTGSDGRYDTATMSDRSQGDPARSATQRIDVSRALDRLPSDQRLALLLVDAEGYSYDEAADILGVAAGTVSSRLSRARATMRTLLEAR